MIIPAVIGNNNTELNRPLKIISTADLHIGRMDLSYQYSLLQDYIIDLMYNTEFDIFIIAGDLFNNKSMANSQQVMYGCLFFNDCVNACKLKNATMIVINGTKEHDDGQLKLFYSYLSDPDLDLRIVEQARFEIVKGIRILCLPEEYNKPQEYYDNLLYYSGMYDIAIVHGMYKGAVYQDKVINTENFDPRNKIFTMEDFYNCKGFILAGHVHTSGCFDKYFYYCGSPYRWSFGEEEAKGFIVAFYNPVLNTHYCYFQEIECYQYKSIHIDNILSKSPDEIINYINLLLQDIEYIRLISPDDPNETELANLEMIKTYYRNNNRVKIKTVNSRKKKVIEQVKEQNDELSPYLFLLDSNLKKYEKFSMYINLKEGYEYITPSEVKSILEDLT